VKTLQEFMGLYFGLVVVALEKIPLDKIPHGARRISPVTDETQILSTHILDKILLPSRPKDAVAVLAITATDLWPGEGWNFVFGQASLESRVGVWSTRRFGDPVEEHAKHLRRVLQVAVHETGHMFGIEHCIAYECCMNGSNSLAESDRNSMVYCCECDPKLWWACKLEPATRAKALAEFSKKHGLQREATEWELIAKALGEM
jgi:archaemetzincin